MFKSSHRWSTEGIFLASEVPPDPSIVFLTAGVMSQLGYCKLAGKFDNINLDASSMSSADLSNLFSAIVGGGTLNNTSNAQSNSLVFLYNLYSNPNSLATQCKNAYLTDIAWLFMWGCFFRIMAYVVLQRQVNKMGK